MVDDLDSLTRFDELLQKGMSSTVELLEENIGKTGSNRATSKADAPNELRILVALAATKSSVELNPAARVVGFSMGFRCLFVVERGGF